ncbi:post-GPI attachment to proteins factor 2 isoform X2 [Bombyx mori]|uniref:CWH43-like N-terminal domain-containing protein n=1 Tax=Bombyx mori TaxID=7091 RepID=A0A8R2QW03_BOMMO|nr:post-GPI attachment to proteins factor 2 [Bombyx mori]
MYLPLHDVSETKYYFRISAKVCFLTVSVPLVAFLCCVIITMVKDFEEANNTHCKVPNIFPSISASVGNFEPQINLAVTLNVLENLSLLGLTHWTSSSNYPYHESCFKTFIGASVFYMLLTCIMLSNCRRRSKLTNKEKYSVKLKWRAFSLNVTSFACAAIFFLRHNRFCEPYVYSMFGFSEYIVVMSNILFHLTSVYDLQIKFIYLTKRGLITE